VEAWFPDVLLFRDAQRRPKNRYRQIEFPRRIPGAAQKWKYAYSLTEPMVRPPMMLRDINA